MIATLDRIATITDPKLLDATEERINRAIARRALEFYAPYPKQREFHRAGGDADVRERLLMAANQVGKTIGAGAETAMHLTGQYPDWWDGIRFEKPVVAWVGSDTGQTTRDNPQRILLGRPGSWGTGMIPAKHILEISKNAHGVKDLVETIVVKHVTGGKSRLALKSYDQGRAKWQGETLNFVWYDEEPHEDIYLEGLTRTNATQGITFLTFTPLRGISTVVRRFMVEKVVGTHITKMTIDDAMHYSTEQRKAIIASYPLHERDARARGIPIMGSGVVFPVAESLISIAPYPIPAHWPRLAALDIGYEHPTAGAWLAWDRDSDCVTVYDTYRVKQQSPTFHAATFRAKGPWIPVAWPHDALQHDKGGSCEQIAEQYRNLGVNMLPEKATHAPVLGQLEGSGGYGLEAGIQAMLDRMQTGRFKVFSHLADWWEEFRLYHRKDGLIVKIGDDLMSATRIGCMMLRHAKVQEKKKRPHIEAFRADPVMGVLR